MSSSLVETKPIEHEQSQVSPVDPSVIVIFGASGDLTRRKLVPALFNLMLAGSLKDFQVLGVGRTSIPEDEFRHEMHDAVAASPSKGRMTEETWEQFAAHLHYTSGEVNDDQTFRLIAERTSELASSYPSRNHLYYMATPPSLAPAIVQGLGKAGLAQTEGGWTRIVIEKPFGRDLESAKALNDEIASVFREDQVYRIDHYLGKETVQNILVFRFGNSMFEPIWNRNYVDYVEVTAAETLGVGSRAGYYEEAGALRDMVANHLLQLLTLTAMEPPVAFDADSVREEKVQVLRSIRRLKPEEVAERTVRGQYGAGEIDDKLVPGYRDEEGVAKDSRTETYVALEFAVSNWRWSGVPFYLRTGKHLGRQLTEIVVHLKRTPQALFARTPDDKIESNLIVLRMQPNEGISVAFGAKQPGQETQTRTVQMDFCYNDSFVTRPSDAYETLLLDVMEGDATLFIRRDEVEAQWRLITPIEEAWANQPVPKFPNYDAGSDGPSEADKLPARNGHHWRELKESRAGCD